MIFNFEDLIFFYRFIFWGYIGLSFLVLFLIYRSISKNGHTSRRQKIIGYIEGFLAVFVIFYSWHIPSFIDYLDERKEKKVRHERYLKAKAVFDERCKTAGWKIYRKVENVDGIRLLKVRPKYKLEYSYDPMWADATLTTESTVDGYIRSFLYTNRITSTEDGIKEDKTNGYYYVDVLEDGAYTRYALAYKDKDAPMTQTPITTPARYAVTYENMVDPADRAMWIAGTKVIVLDTQTNEVLGEAIWYAFDPAQGLGREFRNSGTPPWSNTIICPKSGSYNLPTRLFLDHILISSQTTTQEKHHDH
ncbi:hypothetical protein [Suttonella ornithocola]|uniref:Uncharacterized protein n=1 Tax=Suttonella ornithocola TaxID=279832 RepID=A0A380MNA4_9GAMM|nr:hypothetical protein [Suttonella ornithocola]SUO93728.1 Uncharacterised protein [Suttonella ornithocola]